MMSKLEIVSKEMVKPSSPTPDHLRDFKISLLDQMAPPIYIPIVFFYSASDISAIGTDFEKISDKLKTSLSKVLTLYYPFCGRLKGTSSVECNDAGVLYIESKVPTNLSDILKWPQAHIRELLPFDPYNPAVEHDQEHIVNMAVQLNEFRCGGIGLGVCLSHKVADGATTASFFDAWAATARGHGNIVAPQMDAALVFPQSEIELDITCLRTHETLVTKCFLFNETNLSRLRAKLGSFNPTRVEAVTALIWKSAMEAAKATSGECKSTLKASMVCHAVNIYNRMVPPLPKHLFGNLWLYSISPLVEVDGNGMERLHDLLNIVRNTIRKVDANYLSMLQGDDLDKFVESLMEPMLNVIENNIPCYGFNSWTRFGFYEVDFGWGKPSRVRSINLPMKNVTTLMSTRTGDGIEAWVSLTEHDMVEFQRNPELLQFASLES